MRHVRAGYVTCAKLGEAADVCSAGWREGTPVVAGGHVAGQDHGGPQSDDDQRGERVRHPLDPLDAREISWAVEILRQERL
jgi:Cu2+-containing amine oxidase